VECYGRGRGLCGLGERKIGLSSQVLMDMIAEAKTGE